MNQKTRKELENMELTLELMLERLEELKEAEEDKFENLPENFQDSEQGQAMEAAADNLDEAMTACQELMQCLGEIHCT